EDTQRLAQPNRNIARVPPATQGGAALEGAGGGNDEIAAAAAYMSGWSCFMLNKPDEARNRFAGIVSSYPHSSKAPEALFWLSEHDYNNGRYDSAEKSFRRLANNYPHSPLAEDALFWAGRAALMQNEFKRGRDYFSTLIRQYPSSRKRPEGRYFQGVALCELGQFDAAILIFNEIIKQYPDHESAAFKKADCQFILGSDEPKRYEEAINSYQFTLDRPECSAASRLQAKYKIGRCLEKLGRSNEAFAQYLQVVYLYLQNQESPSCNRWFARAAFNAAGIMEDKQQWRQAVNIYGRVVEADIPASNDAQERIDKLRSENWLSFY
ncbi:MAG: tetratricopeptide repeat protein, partial [Kiritimatiellia bacterium]|nr:tetratricopeptide repeat protein [Kiritimatiellia bacterium]